MRTCSLLGLLLVVQLVQVSDNGCVCAAALVVTFTAAPPPVSSSPGPWRAGCPVLLLPLPFFAEPGLFFAGLLRVTGLGDLGLGDGLASGEAPAGFEGGGSAVV
jgi:hypothetical protein